jgi:hypothetical protein
MTVAEESSPLLRRDSNGSAVGPEDGLAAYKTSSMRDFSDMMMKSFSSIERQQAQALGVGPAAFFIRDAVLGYQDAAYDGFYDPYSTVGTDDTHTILRNTISFVCNRLIGHSWVKRLLYGANWVLFILSFIEPPQWCRDSDLQIAKNNLNDSLSEYGDCMVILNAKGTAADGEENQDYYPNADAMWLTISQSKYVELICIFIILLFLILKMVRFSTNHCINEEPYYFN